MSLLSVRTSPPTRSAASNGPLGSGGGGCVQVAAGGSIRRVRTYGKGVGSVWATCGGGRQEHLHTAFERSRVHLSIADELEGVVRKHKQPGTTRSSAAACAGAR